MDVFVWNLYEIKYISISWLVNPWFKSKFMLLILSNYTCGWWVWLWWFPMLNFYYEDEPHSLAQNFWQLKYLVSNWDMLKHKYWPHNQHLWGTILCVFGNDEHWGRRTRAYTSKKITVSGQCRKHLMCTGKGCKFTK